MGSKLKAGDAHLVNGKVDECARCGKRKKTWLTNDGKVHCNSCIGKTKKSIEWV